MCVCVREGEREGEVVIFRTVEAWEFFAFFLTKKFALCLLGVAIRIKKGKKHWGKFLPLARMGNFIFFLSFIRLIFGWLMG